MEQPTTIGIDLAKTVFQVHGVDVKGAAVMKRKLRRSQVLDFFEQLEPCLIGMEACAGAHYWARQLTAFGHEVRIMPPSYMKPYVKRGKTDAADSEAICEAVTRPTMRFVPVKSAERQAAMLDHKTRDFLVRQRTQLVNAIPSHLSEFGIVVAKGIHNIKRLLEAAKNLPAAARPAVDMLADQLHETQEKIDDVTARIERTQKNDPLARRLATIPGVGAITASAIAATTPEVDNFHSARDYAAWLGLSPQPHSSWWQREARAHLRGWQPIPATAALPRRIVPVARLRRHGPDQRTAVQAAGGRLALAHAGEEAGEGRRCRAGGPYGADRLGADPKRRELQGQPGLTEHAGRPGRQRDGEAQRGVMANGRRHGNRDTQFGPEHPGVRAIDLDPSAGGLHQGARQSKCRNSDAVYMAATDQMPDDHRALAPREPYIHGPSDNGDAAAAR